MSKESAKKFEKDLQSNLSLKNKFEDMLNSASNLSKDEKAKKIIEFINKEGYDVEPADFKDNEIGDDDLSNAAGGVDWKSMVKSAGGAAVTSLLSSYMQNGTLSMDDVKSAAMSAFKEGKSKW